MKFSFKPLSQQVIVLTGASSGIGLATALAAAKQGAKLVLAARNEESLKSAVEQCQAAGGEAIHVTADVGVRADVQRIADAALERFGTFDTWVNDAGLAVWGKLEDASDEDHRRMFETNFWGVVYGSLIAVKHLKQHGGALINLGSVVSDTAAPLHGMYAASKHAVKGFTDALRIELLMEEAPVSVTLIKPGAIDTPFPQHARNYMEREPKLPFPVYPPEEVARAILFAATHAKRDIYVGASARVMSATNRLAPAAMDRMAAKVMSKDLLRDEPPRNPAGALYGPGDDGRVRGDHPGRVMKSSAYTRASMHPVLTTAIVGVVGYAAVSLLTRNGRAKDRALSEPNS